MNIAKKITDARMKKNLSVYELSRKSGVTQVHIHQIEKGITQNPGVVTLAKLSKVLNVSIDEIIN